MQGQETRLVKPGDGASGESDILGQRINFRRCLREFTDVQMSEMWESTPSVTSSMFQGAWSDWTRSSRLTCASTVDWGLRRPLTGCSSGQLGWRGCRIRRIGDEAPSSVFQQTARDFSFRQVSLGSSEFVHEIEWCVPMKSVTSCYASETLEKATFVGVPRYFTSAAIVQASFKRTR